MANIFHIALTPYIGLFSHWTVFEIFIFDNIKCIYLSCLKEENITFNFLWMSRMCICSKQHICNTLAFYHFTHYKSSHISETEWENGMRKKMKKIPHSFNQKKNSSNVSDRVEDGLGQSYREESDTRLKFRIFRTMSNDNEVRLIWHFCYSYRKNHYRTPESVLLPQKGGKSLKNALFHICNSLFINTQALSHLFYDFSDV